MKLSTIFQYVDEGGLTAPRNVDPEAYATFTRPLDVEHAAALITERCSDSIHNPLFRGMGGKTDEPFFASDSSQIQRRSKDNANYYTELLSTGLTSWKGWPRRDRATICTNSAKFAAAVYGHGEFYFVYPENGTTVAVAPTEDIWTSFASMTNLLGSAFGIDDIMMEIKTAGDRAGFATFDEALQLPARKVFPNTKVAANGTVHSFLEQYMSPEFNNFKRGVAGRVAMPTKAVEVWFSGRAVFVHQDAAEQLENLINI